MCAAALAVTGLPAAGAAAVPISQGAHHPVDALGGAALGTAVASGLRCVVGR